MRTLRKRRCEIYIYLAGHWLSIGPQIFFFCKNCPASRYRVAVAGAGAANIHETRGKNLCYSRTRGFEETESARSGERRISIIASNCFIIPAAGANNGRCLSVCRLVATLYKQFILFISPFFLHQSETETLRGKAHSPAAYTKDLRGKRRT